MCVCVTTKIALKLIYLKIQTNCRPQIWCSDRKSGSLQDRQVLIGKQDSASVQILKQEKLTVQILNERLLNQAKGSILLET